jgi:ankyrin repeat protein
LEKAKRAIENGADVNANDDFGEMPLYKACFNGHEAIISLLLENGANINAKSATVSHPF